MPVHSGSTPDEAKFGSSSHSTADGIIASGMPNAAASPERRFIEQAAGKAALERSA